MPLKNHTFIYLLLIFILLHGPFFIHQEEKCNCQQASTQQNLISSQMPLLSRVLTHSCSVSQKQQQHHLKNNLQFFYFKFTSNLPDTRPNPEDK